MLAPHFQEVRCFDKGRPLTREELKDAFRDALTGLPNRVLFLDRLDRVVQHHVRYPDEHFAIISIDVKPLLAGGIPVEW